MTEPILDFRLGRTLNRFYPYSASPKFLHRQNSNLDESNYDLSLGWSRALSRDNLYEPCYL